MDEPPPPSLRLNIDTGALAHNWRALDALSGGASAGAAVKADGYGLGAEQVVPALRDAGCEDFLVAHWSEVAELARHVAPQSIAVLHGPLTRADAEYAITTGVRPVLNSLPQIARWIEAGGGACDVMVDTGINRLGLALANLGDPLLAQLEINTLMSHLASADEDSPLNSRQLAAFREVCAQLPARRRSLANSAGIALGSDYAFDLTRPGLALYGGIPRGELAETIRQVAQPQAAIIQRRRLSPGDSVGYNATFTATTAIEVGVVSLGYADGFLRGWGGEGYLCHADRRLPLLGKVSMDMVVVDLSAAAELAEGDWLDVPYSLPEASRLSGMSQYELLTVLGKRLRAST